MKTIFKLLFLFLALTLLFTQCELFCDDCVDIPDRGFKKILIEQGVDTNGDGSISFIEAEEVNSLYIATFQHNIKDVTGIEAFINLDTFTIEVTKITSLDLSKNTALTYLICRDNQLATLDVSKNTALTNLNCGGNQLATLDVSNCTALECLSCEYNQLTSLDVSKCTALSCLECSGNLLTTLDISNNTSLQPSSSCLCISLLWGTINPCLGNMPSLYEVCVCESFLSYVSYFIENEVLELYIYIENSPNIYFTTDCSQ